AADSTYENILPTSHNNTYEGADGCTGLQCPVVVDDIDEADLFMDQQAARSSRMLADNNQKTVYKTNQADSPACPSNNGGYITGSTSCLGSPQFRHCNIYCIAKKCC
ncbi:hypothetical protein A2U01_0059040, partial [Trifolium medium]|nr:hypothetical protein [Trifolium medium]